MCGIAAVIGLAAGPESELLAERLRAALRHRGPDDEGSWRAPAGAGSLLFVHTRLSILDLSPAGHQPMEDPATGNVLIFNGEIYNYRELRVELAKLDPGYRYRSTSDTEVLLHGYARWGAEVFGRLDGMFAAVFFDARRREVVAARDHLGIKPLYYARLPGPGWIFASEVRAVQASGLCGRDLDSAALDDYLRLGSIQEPATIFSAVRAFPAAHFVRLPLDAPPASLEPTAYWDARRFVGIARDPAEHPALLAATVREQLTADVPMGLFLSAGIDSTVLATLAAAERSGRARLQTFTLSSGDGEDDEAEIAAATARILGLAYEVCPLGDDETTSWVLDGLDALDQPSGDGLNTYLVSRASRAQGLVVALSGAGADELHGSYPHFRQLPSWQRWLRSPGSRIMALRALQWSGRGEEARRLELLLARAPRMAGMLEEKRRYFTPDWVARHGPPRGAKTGAEIRGTDAEAAAGTVRAAEAILGGAPSVSPGRSGDLRSELTLAEFHGYLRNTLLRDADGATMAQAQELRVPYLGRRYVEGVLGMPWSAKGRAEGVNKPLLAALVPLARRAVVARRKTGFKLDYPALLLGPCRAALAEAVETLNRRGFRLEVPALLRDLETPRGASEAPRIWALLALGRYLQRLV